jgi:hypothetical protein
MSPRLGAGNQYCGEAVWSRQICEILFGEPGEDGFAHGLAIPALGQQVLCRVLCEMPCGTQRGQQAGQVDWRAGRSGQCRRACHEAHGLSPAPGLSLS